MFRLGAPQKKDKSGLAGDLEAAIESMKQVPWTALADLKGDPNIIKKIDDAEALLKSLRKALGSC
jgi:ParB family chromosome partitioning protein